MAEIHGVVKVLEEARDKLAALLNNLKTAMTTDLDDPRPAAVYDSHETLVTSFPAFSVDIIGLKALHKEAGFHAYPIRLACQVRVHTDCDYDGVFIDTVKVKRLINSIDNYLKTNAQSYLKTNMADGFVRLWFDGGESEFNSVFAESRTVGGYLSFDMQCNYGYTQA